ncbi:MAG: hypothetical protein U1B77_04020 [Dehalococcoidales bacterium]|nr:hypothetical protein [Dehalococcoidales bacterium]
MDKAEGAGQAHLKQDSHGGISPEMERGAAQRARDRATAARWDLDVAVFLFAVLIIIIILLFQDIGLEVVAPVAIFGLSMVWVVGWRRGRQLYHRFHEEERLKMEQELKRVVEGEARQKVVAETIEEQVQRALRERWR